MDTDPSSSARAAVVPTCAAVAAVGTAPSVVDLAAPTPCSGWDLRAVIEHFAGTSTAMARIGQGEPLDPDDPWGGGEGAAEQDWGARIRSNLHEIARGWSRPEAWEGEVAVGGSPVPRSMLGEMALVEVALHGWDLAVALGRSVDLAPDAARAVHGAVAGTAGLGRRLGAYGPEVPVPDEAPELERALGKAGRDPGWHA